MLTGKCIVKTVVLKYKGSLIYAHVCPSFTLRKDFNTVIMYSNYSSTHLLNVTIVFYIAFSDLNPKLYPYSILKNMVFFMVPE